MNIPENDAFLKACRGEASERTPVWLMRQAGRYMPEYRAIRSGRTILDMIHSPELSAEVTMQPIDAFDLDAAIIFADILTILDEMDLDLSFVAGEGPKFGNPIRSQADVDQISVKPATEALSYTLDAIRVTLDKLENRIPLIGFSGAPFTLACYAIQGQGSRDFFMAKRFMYHEPEAWQALMGKLADAVADYLPTQIDAGVHAVQLFDSWAGCLSPGDYRTYAAPYSRRIHDAIKAAHPDIPIIHFGTDTSAMLPEIKAAAGDVIGVDWRVDFSQARDILGNTPAQGNMDPLKLLGTKDIIETGAREVLEANAGRPGHIFNLGHGIQKETPPENVKILVDYIHQYKG